MLDKTLRNSMIQDVQYCKQQLLQLRSILQEVSEHVQIGEIMKMRAFSMFVTVSVYNYRKLKFLHSLAIACILKEI